MNVIWDNAPAPIRQAQEGRDGEREYLRTLGLTLWLMNPRFHEAGSAGLQPGLQCR